MTRHKYVRGFDVSPGQYPFSDRWFDYQDVAIHYVDEGPASPAGPPVVMLHGNPTWSFLYRNIIQGLDGDCRCLAPDYPGFGFSGHPEGYGYTPREHADAMSAWLDHLQLDRFVLVVQDWGGPIGMSLAAAHPERIAGLVILNTWAWPIDMKMRAFSLVMGGPLGKYLHLQHNFFARRGVPMSTARRRELPDEIFKAYTDPFPDVASRMGTYIFPREIRRNNDWLAETEAGLAEMGEVPVEMVWAMKDPAFGNEACINRWQQIFPQAKVTRLDNANHYLQEDEPDEIADAIRRVMIRLG